MIPRSNNIKTNYVYTVIYQILSVITPIITTPYVTRVFGAELIGIYSYALAVVGYFVIFGLLGINTYGQIEIAKNRDNKDILSHAFCRVLYCKILTMSIALLIYLFFVFFTTRYRVVFTILIVNIISNLIDLTWFFQGIEDFRLITIRNIVIRLSAVILVFTCIKDKNDFILYVSLIAATGFLGNCSLWFGIKKYVHYAHITKREIYNTLKNNLVYFVPAVAAVAYIYLDKCMIQWITQDAKENGFYEQANKIYTILLALMTSLSVVVLPRLSYLFFKDKDDRLIVNIINKATSFVCLTAIPIAFGVIAVSDIFVPFFFGPGFERCIPLLQIFSVVLVITSLNIIISNQCLIAAGKQNEYNKLVVCSTAMNLMGNLMLINKLGCVGAALSSCISETVLLILIVLKSKGLIQVKKMLFNIIKYCVVSILMWGVICFEKKYINAKPFITMGIITISGMCFYCIALTLIKDSFFTSVLKKSIQSIHSHFGSLV